jgi:AraC-like DNA-binding protein
MAITMSSLQIIAPSPPLAPYVTGLWVYDDLMTLSPGPLTILPDTAGYICFLCADPIHAAHKKETYTARSGLSGFQSYRFDLQSPGTISGVTARLTAWGLSAFLGDAVEACAEMRVDCHELFPRAEVRELEERLFHLQSAAARAQCVEAFLLAHLRERSVDRLVRAACSSLARTGGSLPVNALARDFGLSERTLERRFLRSIGTTPKKYARVLRLQQAVQLRERYSSWAEIAHAAGYYDQSHLIRDCREMYGDSPEALFSLPLSEAAQSFHAQELSDLSNTAGSENS